MKTFKAGSTLFFLNWEKRRVCGFMLNKPNQGDILEAEMESGKIARFQFGEIELCGDPSDQFFSTVKDVGYK